LINGINGRMGRSLTSLLSKQNNFECIDYKEFVSSTGDITPKNSAIIDFSHASGLRELLLNKYQLPLISGTTNLEKSHMDLANDYALTAPIMLASNFSYGVQKLSFAIKAYLLKNPDIKECNITEVHHTEKKDAPSGTAKSLAHEISALIPDLEMNFLSLRKHNVFGLHSVSFLTADKEVIFHHQAFNRDIFAKGAIAAALWLKEQENGLYGFDNFFQNNL
jgi:4-hydroxy-tetrahydrodipicolinate reductase